MSEPRLVLCSGAPVGSESPLREGRRVLELDALGPRANITIKIESVTDAFAAHLSDRLVDLLEIASYVYAADFATERKGRWSDGDSTEPWDRDFLFVIPVREVDFWDGEEVKKALVNALKFLSNDRFSFEFLPLDTERSKEPYLNYEDWETSRFVGAGRVHMFSGGLDSLVGAVESAARGEPLILVGHRPIAPISRRQLDLCAAMRRELAVPIIHLPVWVQKDQRLDIEYSQRTRSFLYSAIGVVVAEPLQAGGVQFSENGVVSLNLPVTDEPKRSRASRTTHPAVLAHFSELYRLVTGRAFAVDNPYAFRTRAEMVKLLDQRGARELIRWTCSCTHTIRRAKRKPHCGLCGQCIDRRVAILAAGLEAEDPEANYAVDPFTAPRAGSYERKIAAGYLELARQVLTLSPEVFVGRYNAELTRAARPLGKGSSTIMQFVDMLQRHAETVRDVIRQQENLHWDDVFTGQIDRTSMLGMVGRRDEVFAPADGAESPTAEPEAQPGSAGDLVFEREGKKWQIRYGGRRVFVDRCVGMLYIQYLLQQPGAPFHVRELSALVNRAEQPVQARERLIEDDFGNENGAPVDSDLTCDQDDADLIETYRECIRDLDQQIKRAKEAQDSGSADDLRTRRQQLLETMSVEFGLDGKPRRKGDPNKKAYDRVSAALKAARREIGRHHGALSRHLDNSLKYEHYQYTYTPEKPLTWLT